MKTITRKLPDRLHAELTAAAKEKGLSTSQFIRQALENHIARWRHGKSAPRAFDLVGHLSGRISGPADILTNPKYMEGFGRAAGIGRSSAIRGA